MPYGQNIYSVSQINRYIKSLLDGDGGLNGVFVRGEISNYKCYPSGHHYFSLKDEEGSLRCVMFRREAERLRFRPENGMKVIAFGRITVFPRDGQYQLYCGELTPDGVGDLHVAFEQLKEKLFREGLFDKERKKPLPRYPAKIALVTSPVGAAVRDMLRILNARWPLSRVVVVPVRVQGKEAAGEIAAGIALVNRLGLADLIITGRGGGSMEDLWAFNEEAVARAICASRIPVVSAVGHEPDVTIADFAADLRAATPSNAAELAVPDQNEVRAYINGCGARLGKAESGLLNARRQEIRRLEGSRALRDPRTQIEDRRLLIDYHSRRMAAGMQRQLSRYRERFVRLAAGLDAMSPFKVLARGYCMAYDKNGAPLTSVRASAPGEDVLLRLRDGELACEVKERKCSDDGGEKTEL